MYFASKIPNPSPFHQMSRSISASKETSWHHLIIPQQIHHPQRYLEPDITPNCSFHIYITRHFSSSCLSSATFRLQVVGSNHNPISEDTGYRPCKDGLATSCEPSDERYDSFDECCVEHVGCCPGSGGGAMVLMAWCQNLLLMSPRVG